MRIASTVARYLLGVMFTVFGLNGFLMFFPPPPVMPSPLSAQFMTVMSASHYMLAVSAIQLLCGLLLLANRWVALALTMLAAVIFNIVTYHVTMDPKGIAPGLVVAVLWALVFARHRAAFAGLLAAREPATVA